MSGLTAAKYKPASFFSYVRLTWDMAKLSILTALEYRTNFLTQVFGMVVNNFGLLAIWIIFFRQVPSVRGWQFEDTALMFAVATVNYGLVMIFTGGTERLAKIIAEGSLDYFLALPKNPLWHVSVSRTMIAAIGDVIFGVGVFLLAGSPTWERTLVFILVSFLSAVVLYNFVVIAQCLGFFSGNFEDAADRIIWMLESFCHYPYPAFSGALKFISQTFIPALFVAWLPVSIIKNFSLIHTLWLLGFGLVTFFIAISIFHYGLKRYESGNLINLRL